MRLHYCNWRSGASHVGTNCSANRLEGHHVQSSPIRRPPPRLQPTRHAKSSTRAWSDLPALRRQEVLLVLSQIIAKTLPSLVLKEGRHEHF